MNNNLRVRIVVAGEDRREGERVVSACVVVPVLKAGRIAQHREIVAVALVAQREAVTTFLQNHDDDYDVHCSVPHLKPFCKRGRGGIVLPGAG